MVFLPHVFGKFLLLLLLPGRNRRRSRHFVACGRNRAVWFLYWVIVSWSGYLRFMRPGRRWRFVAIQQGPHRRRFRCARVSFSADRIFEAFDWLSMRSRRARRVTHEAYRVTSPGCVSRHMARIGFFFRGESSSAFIYVLLQLPAALMRFRFSR